MSREAVQYVSRHVIGRPPAGVPKSTWMEAQTILYFIADMSNPSGHGCTVSQTTIGDRFDLRRQRVNELVGVLVDSGAIEKVPGRRAYVVAGVQDHDPTTCGNSYCEKEAQTVFRRGQKGRGRQKPAKGSLSVAAAEAASRSAWVASRDLDAVQDEEFMTRWADESWNGPDDWPEAGVWAVQAG